MAVKTHEQDAAAQTRPAACDGVAAKSRPEPVPVEERWALAQKLAAENKRGLQLLADSDRNHDRRVLSSDERRAIGRRVIAQRRRMLALLEAFDCRQ